MRRAIAGYRRRVSEAAKAPAPSGATPWLAGASALGAVLLSIYALTRDPAPAPAGPGCLEPPPFAWTADPTWLAAWGQQASGARVVVQQDLNAWGERWVAAHQEACALEPQARDGVVQCLDRHADRARALAEALHSLAPERQAEAFAVATGLPPSEDCAHARVEPPTDPAVIAALDLAQASLDTGQPERAAEALEGLDLEDEDPLRARVGWLRGRLAEPREAPEIWQRALTDAIAHDQPALACSIALELAAGPREDLAGAQRWWALASAHARRLPTTAARQHALLHTQADLLHRHGQPAGALALYEPALAVLESARGGTHPSLVEGLRAAAVAAAAVGKLDAAERLAKRALELTDDGLGARHPQALAILEAIAVALQSAGAPERAMGWRRMELQRRDEATHGPTLAALGEASLQAEIYGDAGQSFERAATWAADHDDEIVGLQAAIGRAAVAQAKGDADAAADHLEAARHATTDPVVRNTLQLRRVAVLLDAGRLTDARDAAAAALADAEGHDDATWGEALTVAADVALRSEHADEAIVLARRAVAALVRAHGREHASVLVALTHLGTACLDQGRNDDAAAAFARAAEISAGASPEIQIASALGWATALWRTGAKQEAEAIAVDAQQMAARHERADATADVAAWMAARGLAPAAPAP